MFLTCFLFQVSKPSTPLLWNPKYFAYSVLYSSHVHSLSTCRLQPDKQKIFTKFRHFIEKEKLYYNNVVSSDTLLKKHQKSYEPNTKRLPGCHCMLPVFFKFVNGGGGESSRFTPIWGRGWGRSRHHRIIHKYAF